MTKCNFKSLLKQYTIFYLIYLFITKQDIYKINTISIIFYILLIIKIFVEFKNIINE